MATRFLHDVGTSTNYWLSVADTLELSTEMPTA